MPKKHPEASVERTRFESEKAEVSRQDAVYERAKSKGPRNKLPRVRVDSVAYHCFCHI